VWKRQVILKSLLTLVEFSGKPDINAVVNSKGGIRRGLLLYKLLEYEKVLLVGLHR
jgi:ATP-dependent protease ClpP protease subunit